MSATPASFEVPPSSRGIKVYYRGEKELSQGEPFTLKYTEWCLDEATGVCVCFLSNPKKLNPFTFNLLWEVLFCVEHAERDPRVKVVIWAGRGRCFSGGADFTSLFAIDIDPEIIAGYRRVGKGMARDMDVALQGVTQRLLAFKKLSISAVHGPCIGGGANFALLLHDFVFISKSAKFRYPFAELGIPAEVGSSFLLPYNVGPQRAKELLMLGEFFGAEKAFHLGLAHQIVEKDEDLLPTAIAFAATKLAHRKYMDSYAYTKALVNGNLLAIMKAHRSLDKENEAFEVALKSEGFMAAMAAFKAKIGGKKKQGAQKSKTGLGSSTSMGRLSKDKRDIYYRLAKEEGYRARSAYKLLQVDEQFHILGDDLERVVDLCAAPGSWSQVLSKKLCENLKGSEKKKPLIVSVDLQEMAPIPDVTCIQGDITSEKTVKEVLDCFGGQLSDLVVCDGAPDVTGMHDMDEYVQFQLLLAALNITTLLLKPGGSFVAKVFRGENVDLLYAKMYVFFECVWVAKPRSSRNSSVESFIICKNFRLPKGYTPRLYSAHEFKTVIEGCEATQDEKRLVPFVACGDLSGYDADMNYSAPTDSSEPLAPVQPPINPAYADAIREKKESQNKKRAKLT
ncbi:putative tRNA (cytidine(32)/guanosine(34)-2'-O)-methyltransferase [Perkinsus olseni]|uniref:Putative tRNA (cytidine(32)/guanosine(34)-2'-O)-methyltransferase n=1 Tax=Perkinsus olseni TaxID=32597 RepID=A0A7J6M0L7_PEROL|nr:putative tRNA (cytidine(32)/guanosine(34)-2'-O)-methyltransferase [Perkinsus olseni]